MPLTPKQEAFINEYMIDLNGTQAAIRAGYSPRTANEQAARLLAKVNIRAQLDKKLAERSKRTGITADRVLRELARIGFVKPTHIVNVESGKVDDEDDDDTAAIQSIKVKKSCKDGEETVEREVRFHDKTKSLELIGKHLGMWDDKTVINNNVNVENPYKGLTTEDLKKLAKSADSDD